MKPWQRLILSLGGLFLVWAAFAAAWMQDRQIPPIARTALVLFSTVWVLGSLAFTVRIFPNRALAWVMFLPVLLTMGAVFDPTLANVALLVDAALAAIALLDLLTLPGQAGFSAERETGRIVSLKQGHKVTLTISNRSRRIQTVSLRDGVPHELQPEPDEFQLKLAPRSRATVHYQIRSVRRGAFLLERVFLRTG
ncbi:MAG: hypothetical protein AB7O62_25170, partial [Pirellulales bacterium]